MSPKEIAERAHAKLDELMAEMPTPEVVERGAASFEKRRREVCESLGIDPETGKPRPLSPAQVDRFVELVTKPGVLLPEDEMRVVPMEVEPVVDVVALPYRSSDYENSPPADCDLLVQVLKNRDQPGPPPEIMFFGRKTAEGGARAGAVDRACDPPVLLSPNQLERAMFLKDFFRPMAEPPVPRLLADAPGRADLGWSIGPRGVEIPALGADAPIGEELYNRMTGRPHRDPFPRPAPPAGPTNAASVSAPASPKPPVPEGVFAYDITEDCALSRDGVVIHSVADGVKVSLRGCTVDLRYCISPVYLDAARGLLVGGEPPKPASSPMQRPVSDSLRALLRDLIEDRMPPRETIESARKALADHDARARGVGVVLPAESGDHLVDLLGRKTTASAAIAGEMGLIEAKPDADDR